MVVWLIISWYLMPIQARRSYQDETQVIKLQVNVWLWNSIWETGIKWTDDTNTHLTLTNPSTVRVVGALQIIPQPVSSVLLCSPLPSGTWRTPGLSIPWCCLPTSSSVCLVFFPLSRCLAKWFWPDLINRRHDHTTAVCVSLRWSGVFVWSDCLLDLGTDFLIGNMVFVWDA